MIIAALFSFHCNFHNMPHQGAQPNRPFAACKVVLSRSTQAGDRHEVQNHTQDTQLNLKAPCCSPLDDINYYTTTQTTNLRLLRLKNA